MPTPQYYMELVRVWTDGGARKPVALLAKIIERHGVISTIRYLSEGPDNIWRYEDDTYEIDDDSIAEHLGTDQESAIGFRVVVDEDGFVREDSDDDYVLEDSSEDDETDEDEVESGTEDEEEDLDEESDSEESLGEE